MSDYPPLERTAPVNLREVTSETVVAICKLSDTLSPAHRRMGFQRTGEVDDDEVVLRLPL